MNILLVVVSLRYCKPIAKAANSTLEDANRPSGKCVCGGGIVVLMAPPHYIIFLTFYLHLTNYKTANDATNFTFISTEAYR